MGNSMTKDLISRYEDYLRTYDEEERNSKLINYWVMSTIESIFWSYQLKTSFYVDLFASEEKFILVFCDATEEDHEFVHYPFYDCDDDKLAMMLQKFVKDFNNIDYSLSGKVISPSFRAYYYGTSENTFYRKNYNGYNHVGIYCKMLPNSDDNPANHGIYA